jgi:hypothetical protein
VEEPVYSMRFGQLEDVEAAGFANQEVIGYEDANKGPEVNPMQAHMIWPRLGVVSTELRELWE